MFENFSPFFYLSLMSGITAISAGLALRFFPPKNRNWFYGYRTKRSSKSQESWDFAQRHSSNGLILFGIIPLALAPLDFVVDFNETNGAAFGIALLLLILVVPILRTEKELKNRFDKEK